MTQTEEQKQNPILDQSPLLLADAQKSIKSMNEMAEHLERARSPRRQTEIAQGIEAEKRWLREKDIVWEEVYINSTSARYALKRTEKQLQEFAQMMHRLNIQSQEKDIERMYYDLSSYLAQLERTVKEGRKAVAEKKLGRLSGSNELKVYSDSSWHLIQRIQASEKVFALVTRDESENL